MDYQSQGIVSFDTDGNIKIPGNLCAFHLFECFLRCSLLINCEVILLGKFKPVIKKAMVELDGMYICSFFLCSPNSLITIFFVRMEGIAMK